MKLCLFWGIHNQLCYLLFLKSWRAKSSIFRDFMLNDTILLNVSNLPEYLCIEVSEIW